MTRLQPDLLGQLDDWIEKQDDAPSRPEAIRRLLAKALAGGQSGGGAKSRQTGKPK